jgi:predicted dehydrogenase
MNSVSRSQTRAASRRTFLKTTSAFMAATALSSGIARPGYAAESNVIRIALVGCGGRGTGAASNALATQTGPVQLVAMADIFEPRLKVSYETLAKAVERKAGSADSWIMGVKSSQVDVPPERRFLGFDAYQKAMDCLRPGDVVILTTPVAFRWVHFRYAIQKGLHVFMEKPISVDGPTSRRMLELAEEAQKKDLKVGVGLMCRHCQARWALYERLQSGAIGDLTTLRTYRLVGPAGFYGPRQENTSELLWQTKNYLGFLWASGGLFHDYVAHNVDECCWMKNDWPVRAHGLGARCYRGDCVDQNFDLYSVEYTFPDGAKLFLNARNMTGCHEEFASYAQGTKGSAVISTLMHTPARCRIYQGHVLSPEHLTWSFPQPEPNPYQREWEDLMNAIRQNQKYNEVKRGVDASLTVLMGRMAVHTGQVITREAMLNHRVEFAPDIDRWTSDTPAPVLADAQGKYPLPQPGILTDREY